MRGRKPKPTALKLISGNPGKRKINKTEPKIQLSDNVPPEWLTDSQKDIWNIAVESSPKGLITTVDESMLITWVIACDTHRKASEQVNKLGLIIKSPVKGEPMQNPYLSIMNRQAQLMMKSAAELGFTPSSRSRVSLNNNLGQDNPFFQILNG